MAKHGISFRSLSLSFNFEYREMLGSWDEESLSISLKNIRKRVWDTISIPIPNVPDLVHVAK